MIKTPKNYVPQIARVTEKTLAEAGELFAYRKPVEIVIFSSIPDFVIPELGIGAHATIQGDVVVNIDFSRRDIKHIIQKELSPTLYHEFSHVVRASIYRDLYATLSESLITEGIASYIERKIFRKKIPYIEPIKNERKYWLQARKNMKKKPYNHSEWFFGYGKLPRWIGYRLGYLLVESFMKRQKNRTLAQLVRTKSNEIFAEAKISS